MEAAQEIGAVIFGHFQLTELIDGFWVEHLKIEYRRNDPENPQILYRQPGEWGPLEDSTGRTNEQMKTSEPKSFEEGNKLPQNGKLRNWLNCTW